MLLLFRETLLDLCVELLKYFLLNTLMLLLSFHILCFDEVLDQVESQVLLAMLESTNALGDL
jgi:hypothetical protein